MGFKGTVFLRPVDANLLVFLCAFLETLDHQLCGHGVAATLEDQGSLRTLVEVERGPLLVKAAEPVFFRRGEVLVGVLLSKEAQGIQFVQGERPDGPVLAVAVLLHFAVLFRHLLLQIAHRLFADVLYSITLILA